ncbi:MAG TPA: LAGLIDADG family homing endonuclease [Acidimicrobiales bacterium]|nr:LAGLIDADG family homing endonuclease [Acidimicrobiales bacterium]
MVEDIGYTLGGLIAGEGCFSVARRQESFRDGSPRLRFVFAMSLADRDLALLVALQQALHAGAIRHEPARSERWLAQVVLTVTGERSHLRSTIPFCERFLLPSAKRVQFEQWRDRLLEYRRRRSQLHPTGRSVCREPGCTGLVRGRGLCRHHYYLETGW